MGKVDHVSGANVRAGVVAACDLLADQAVLGVAVGGRGELPHVHEAVELLLRHGHVAARQLSGLGLGGRGRKEREREER